MTISTALLVQIRAYYKRAMDLMIAGKKTEDEAKKFFEYLKEFVRTDEPIELTHAINPGPGFHIQVEPQSLTRRKGAGTDETEVIDLPDKPRKT